MDSFRTWRRLAGGGVIHLLIDNKSCRRNTELNRFSVSRFNLALLADLRGLGRVKTLELIVSRVQTVVDCDPGCPGPPNLSVCRSDHNILIRWPLLYPSTENSQGLVFGGHDAQQSAATADPSSQGLAGLR